METIQQDVSIPTVTIDGGAGTGKTTVCALTARKLGFTNFDSGILYRGMGLVCFRLDISEKQEMVSQAYNLDVCITADNRIMLNQSDETELILSDDVGRLASSIAKIGEVRIALRNAQLKMRRMPGLVTCGRDQGSVFDTQHRFFLRAKQEVLAERRVRQFALRNQSVDFNTVLAEIRRRDEEDLTRKVDPLIPHPSARVIDVSDMKAEEVADLIVSSFRANE